MMLLISVFSLGLATLPAAGAGPDAQSGNDVRVPFAAGLATIYHDACAAMSEGGSAAAVQACVDDAVSLVVQDVDRADYAQCDGLGGILVSRIAPCAEATLQLALLDEDRSIADLAAVVADAHRQCTAAVLCEGQEPEPWAAHPDRGARD